jgi:para-aminobenzoate synthetase component 1
LLRVGARRSGARYEVIAETRPIKGTAPRGSDEADDAARARALLASQKDAAEHLMIVDLLRNDLGRVARIGSVHADGPRLLTLPTLHHLASTVEADVGGAGLAALLAAVLPGGSVTGAPKMRAVEIIAALEGRVRGVYCGAVGWLGAGRALDFALPIRTGVLRDGELLVPVGGGVVVDSTPEGEWQETMVKARAWELALDA